MTWMGEKLDEAERFFRGSFFGHTWLLVLLGAGSANPDPTGIEIAALVLIGLNYHFFGYVHNDLIDLPVDRTQPLRANDPLVAGRISERQAWIFALIQIPISYATAYAAGAGVGALLVLSVGYAATVAYNVYGKRCPVPMVTDGVQGVAWGSLALFGVLLVGQPTTLSWIPVAFGFAYIFLINGVHGGLRDLGNDLARGRLTTSIYLGARPLDDGAVHVTTRLRTFAVFAFALLLAPTLVLWYVNALPYEGAVLILTMSSWLLVNVCGAWLLYQVLKTNQPNRLRAIYQHQLPLLAPPILIMLPALGWPLQITLLCCFFLPMFLFVPRVRNVANYFSKAEAYPDNPLE